MQEETKGKIPDPYVLSFVTCDDIIVDVISKRPTLVNVLDKVSAISYPALHPKLGLFTELTNGHGKVSLEIRMIDTDTESPVFKIKGEIQFASPLVLVTSWFTVYNLVLPKPGEYRVQLFGNDMMKPIIERRFHAIHRERPNADTQSG